MATGTADTLHIVIVNYKSSDYLAGCLSTIPASLEGLQISVTVVDNNSGEEAELKRLQDIHGRVEFIYNNVNLGFAGACNQGIRSRDSDLCLLLNPDTEVNREALAACARHLLETPDAGIAGCRILNPDGSEQKASRRNIPTPGSAFLHFTGLQRFIKPRGRIKAYHPADPGNGGPRQVEAVSGSFLMFKRIIGAEIGFLDEAYFMYGEDLDFCYRCLQAGWKTFYLPQASILHYKRVSSSRSAASANLHFYQAMEIFYRKHYYPRAGWVSRASVLFGIRLLQSASRARRRITGNRQVGSAG